MKSFIYGLRGTNEDAPFQSISDINLSVGGNTGNLAFSYAIAKQLKYPVVKSWMEEKSIYFDEKYTGVLTLANQIGQHENMGYFAKLLERHTAKLVGIGLGAQAEKEGPVEIPEGTKRWLQIIADRSPKCAPNIGLRGSFTHEVLKSHGLADNTVVLGCPTLFISPNPMLGDEIQKRWNQKKGKRWAVAAGNPYWLHLKKIEQSLIAQLDSFGDYIPQSPISTINFGRGHSMSCSVDEIHKIKDYLMPALSDGEFESWRMNHAYSFFSASAWIEHLKRFDFVIGVRIHGVMLALQAGIPAMCIVHDTRTRELCQTMLIPYIEAMDIINGFDKQDILDKFNFNKKYFNEKRRELARSYCAFLESNNLPFDGYLLRLA